jgi:membrane protease YdiL (CAAX protease family)
MDAGDTNVPFWQRPEVMRRGSGLWKTFWIVGVLAVLLWAVVLLPLYFQPPRGGEICGRSGGCQATPSSDYYPALALFTVILLGMAAGLFYALFTKFTPGAPSR